MLAAMNQGLEGWVLVIVGGDDELSGLAVGYCMCCEPWIEKLSSPDTEACLQRAGRVVQASVNHLAVSRADSGTEPIFALEHEDFAALPSECSGGRQADDSCSYDDDISGLCHATL